MKPTVTGLFGGNTTQSLFSGNNKLSTNNTTSLFSKSTGDDNKPKVGGLFGNPTPTTENGSKSIFNFQNNIPPIKNGGSSLFGNPSLFQSVNTPQSNNANVEHND